MMRRRRLRLLTVIVMFLTGLQLISYYPAVSKASAHAAPPAWVEPLADAHVAGDFQHLLSPSDKDWSSSDPLTKMRDPGATGIYRYKVWLPEGQYQYKIVIGGSDWLPGQNVKLSISAAAGREVVFQYNSRTKTVSDSVNNPNSFVSLPGDFAPLMKDHVLAAGQIASVADAVYTVTDSVYYADISGQTWTPGDPVVTLSGPSKNGKYYGAYDFQHQGTYNYKYYADGNWEPGANISFHANSGMAVGFLYDSATHSVKDSTQNGSGVAVPVLVGTLQTALGGSANWNPGDMDFVFHPGVNGYYFYQAFLPAGTYQYKVAMNGNWTASYVNAGSPHSGGNSVITVPSGGEQVVFTYDPATHNVYDTMNEPDFNPTQAGHDNQIAVKFLTHDSRDSFFRSPFGAVKAGTAVTLRFESAAGDLTSASVHLYPDASNPTNQFGVQLPLNPGDAGKQAPARDYPMKRVGQDPSGVHDAYQVTIPAVDLGSIGIYDYYFVLQDGSAKAYYGNNSSDFGGMGQAYSSPPANGYQLTVYAPDYKTPNWLKNANIYQIFVDRFADGNQANDENAKTDEPVYGNKVHFHSSWSGLPDQPPQGSDFFGGDLQGVIDKLPYLKSLGINAIYMNPIFESVSNHKYDTADYKQIDHHFGSNPLFQELTKKAHALGIHIILDGVFNHTGSDSKYFDKYGRYYKATGQQGAADSKQSPYYPWYFFQNWPKQYTGWANYASLPKLRHWDPKNGFDYSLENFLYGLQIPTTYNNQGEVQKSGSYNTKGVGEYWLQKGADGWRFDVANEVGHVPWQQWRAATKSMDPNSVMISEIWSNASAYFLGNEMDSTMDYLFRNAMLNFLGTNGSSPGSPTRLDQALGSMRENYPKQALYSLMNLVDSHDTERILWDLGDQDAKQNNPLANAQSSDPQVQEAFKKLKELTILQYTYPGAPTLFYGDEAGVTGNTDPDTRRTYPWGNANQSLVKQYQTMMGIRNQHPVLRTGNYQTLLTDDTHNYFAFGRKGDAFHPAKAASNGAAVVAINNGNAAGTITVPVQGYLPDGTVMTDELNMGANGTHPRYTVSGGKVVIPGVAGHWGAVLIASAVAPAPAAPSDLTAQASDGEAALNWSPSETSGVQYNIYRSTVSGGLYQKVNDTPVAGTTYTDGNLTDAKDYYYVVRAVVSGGNESAASHEVRATPFKPIGWAGNLSTSQDGGSPANLQYTLDASSPTLPIYAQIYMANATGGHVQAPNVMAQIGYALHASEPAPSGWTDWTPMKYAGASGHNDVYEASLAPEKTGAYDIAARFSTDGGHHWTYAKDAQNGWGTMSVSANLKYANAPAAPTGLTKKETANSITLSWSPNSESDIYGYNVLREAEGDSGFTKIATVTAGVTSYQDASIKSGVAYRYKVQAINLGWLLSPLSAAITAQAASPLVPVTFTVAVPSSTPAGDAVMIAGSFPNDSWDPGSREMKKTDANRYTITLELPAGYGLDYKYARGSWDKVEKNAAGAEMSNRHLTVEPEADGSMSVNDTVANWRDQLYTVNTSLDHSAVTTPNVTITGTAGTALNTSGQPGLYIEVKSGSGSVVQSRIPIQSDGTWSQKVALQPGGNTVTITDRDSEPDHVLHILYGVAAVKQPADGLVTTKNAVEVSGTAAANTAVSVNGNPVAADAAGNWCTSVSLVYGDNLIKVTGTNGSLTSNYQLHVRYVPVIVNSPADRTETTADTITVSGIAEAGAAVAVDGQPVKTDADGNWRLAVPLQGGRNTITVKAVKGSESYTVTREVTYNLISLDTLLNPDIFTQDALTFASKTITLTGEALPSVTSMAVSIDGDRRPVAVQPDHTWTAQLYLSPGSHQVVLSAFSDKTRQQLNKTFNILPFSATGTEIRKGSVIVTGTIVPQVSEKMDGSPILTSSAAVTVNGIPAVIQSDGTWTAKVPFQPHAPLVIKARTTYAEMAVTLKDWRVLHYPGKSPGESADEGHGGK